MSDKDVQVQILLVPRQTKYRIPDTPILVPGRLQRYGLSEIVNHLLGLDKPVPFDFLIDNQFLRKSLLEYLQENGVSLETVVTIEYIESMLPPKQLASADQGDWISSISTLDESHFLVASYDGTVCVRNTSLECESTLSGGHRGLPVKATAAIPGDSRTRFVSSGQDNTVVGWGVIEGGGNEPGPLYRGMGHTGSVDSVCANQMGTHLLTGSADGTLMVWTTEVPDESEITESKPVTKRAKAEQHAANIVLKAPLATCRDHVGAVTAVSFNRSSDKQAFSGGWDHSVRTWDMEICTNVTTRVCEKVVLSVDHSSQNGLLASGHADKNIRLWDTRADDTSMVKLSLLGHSSWVPSVRWSPTSPYMLASASHDGSLRVWDIRSRTPLHTIKPSGSDAASTRVSHARHERLLALEWSHGFLATGGESGKLSIYQVQ